MMMCVTLAPKGLSFKTKRGRGSQRMMLCEPERGHRGEEGGEGEGEREGAGHNGGAGASHGFSSPVGW